MFSRYPNPAVSLRPKMRGLWLRLSRHWRQRQVLPSMSMPKDVSPRLALMVKGAGRGMQSLWLLGVGLLKPTKLQGGRYVLRVARWRTSRVQTERYWRKGPTPRFFTQGSAAHHRLVGFPRERARLNRCRLENKLVKGGVPGSTRSKYFLKQLAWKVTGAATLTCFNCTLCFLSSPSPSILVLQCCDDRRCC
jgi:hypothetical protein